MTTEWNVRQLAVKYELGRPLSEETVMRLFKQISKIVPLQNKTLLDAGCGTGRISIPLCREFNSLRVMGIDKSEEMIDVLINKISKQRINNFEVKKSDLSNIEFQNDYFDFSLISSVLHSIPNWKEVIKEIIRITKKGGYLFLISEQGDIYDIGLERKKSRNHNLLEKFWGKYVDLRRKYKLESPEKSQVGVKWRLGEPELVNFLRQENYVESESAIKINWKKEFSIRDSLEIIKNRCWSSMFTADNEKFDKIIRDMKGWIEDEKISLRDTYASNFIVNCVVIKLKHPSS